MSYVYALGAVMDYSAWAKATGSNPNYQADAGAWQRYQLYRQAQTAAQTQALAAPTIGKPTWAQIQAQRAAAAAAAGVSYGSNLGRSVAAQTKPQTAPPGTLMTTHDYSVPGAVPPTPGTSGSGAQITHQIASASGTLTTIDEATYQRALQAASAVRDAGGSVAQQATASLQASQAPLFGAGLGGGGMTMYLVIGGAALVAILLLKKRKSAATTTPARTP